MLAAVAACRRVRKVKHSRHKSHAHADCTDANSQQNELAPGTLSAAHCGSGWHCLQERQSQRRHLRRPEDTSTAADGAQHILTVVVHLLQNTRLPSQLLRSDLCTAHVTYVSALQRLQWRWRP